MLNRVPQIRIQTLNDCPPVGERDFVLYWMIASRRTRWNFALDRAVEWANELKRPLVILEPLRVDYPWASDRFHAFVIDGMAANARSLANRDVLYYPYVERQRDQGKGLLATMARRARVVITDDYPCFFLPKIIQAASQRVDVRFEAVDSNGLLPMRAADRVFTTAFSFRRFLQGELPRHLEFAPRRDPLARASLPRLRSLSGDIQKRWPSAEDLFGANQRAVLATLPIDHAVAIAPQRGGSKAGKATLDRFIQRALPSYASLRNEPEADGTSGLSPYLHFGHVSAHEVFQQVTTAEGWSIEAIGEDRRGRRAGWWGLSESAEAFLDQLITWRELGFNMCWQREDYDRYDSLPDWARKTLAKHARDRRETVYSLDEFAAAATHDRLWNAAQRQLASEGRIHNYLRMLWGKKILEWSPSPEEALDVMIELNNKYALDGRDPNSYSGIFWVLGRYDRPWGPERAIFGTVRYMSSQNTARKVNVKDYVERYIGDRDAAD